MRIPARFGLISAILLLPVACAKKEQEEKKPSTPAAATHASVRYDAWNEDIVVDAEKMTILHTVTEYQYDPPTSSTPSGSEVKTLLDGKVTREDLETLAKLVRESGFMELKDGYGAAENQRYYPYTIEVTFRGEKPKKVLYRSGPGGDASPEAFVKLEKHLKALSDTVRKR